MQTFEESRESHEILNKVRDTSRVFASEQFACTYDVRVLSYLREKFFHLCIFHPSTSQGFQPLLHVGHIILSIGFSRSTFDFPLNWKITSQ